MRGRLVVFKLNRYRSSSDALADPAQEGESIVMSLAASAEEGASGASGYAHGGSLVQVSLTAGWGYVMRWVKTWTSLTLSTSDTAAMWRRLCTDVPVPAEAAGSGVCGDQHRHGPVVGGGAAQHPAQQARTPPAVRRCSAVEA